MAVIVMASASGAPGVTTTALGLALCWPRPVVLVDADPVGGSAILAGYLQGGVVHNDAMVQLVLAARDGRLGEMLPAVMMPIADTDVSLLPGPRSHAQAASVVELWGSLLFELRGLERNGQDVIVDAGRLGMGSAPSGLIAGADVGLLVTRSDLPALAAARQWAAAWQAGALDGTAAAMAGSLVIGEHRPYSRRDVQRTLGLPVLEAVAWDPDAAQVLSVGRSAGRKFATSRLARSLATVAAALDRRLSDARQDSALRQEVIIR